jgi:hypothetical protein
METLDSEKLAKLKKASQQIKNVGGFGPTINVEEVAENTKKRGAKMKKR